MQSKASNPLKSSSICFVNQSSKSLIDLRQSNTAFYTNIRMRKGPFVSLGFGVITKGGFVAIQRRGTAVRLSSKSSVKPYEKQCMKH